MPRGGHFSSWEEPELTVADIRDFFSRSEVNDARGAGRAGSCERVGNRRGKHLAELKPC